MIPAFNRIGKEDLDYWGPNAKNRGECTARGGLFFSILRLKMIEKSRSPLCTRVHGGESEGDKLGSFQYVSISGFFSQKEPNP